MIRCMIVDDEPLAIRILTEYVSKVPDLQLIAATSDVFSALQLAQNNEVDLVFLDIQMPELTGIQFMKILNGKCHIILTTAYEEYALQGFEHDVIDYLLKPFSLDRFIAAVNKAKARSNTNVVNQPPTDYIFIKSEYRIIKLWLKDILYFESLRDYVAIHTPKEKILTLQSLRSFEESLPAHNFIRVHKSYIIPIDKIDAVEKKRIIINNTYIPIGDSYIDAFKNKLSLK